MPVHSNHFIRYTTFFMIVTVAVVMMVSMTMMLSQAAIRSKESPQQVQPLDPLTPQEIEIATQVANSDGRVKTVLGGGRTRLVQVQFFALKRGREESDAERLQIGRHAAVLFYRYDGDQGVHVVVDLERRAIVSVDRIEGRSVPLSPDEITDAFNLAARNERVRTLLGARLNEFRVANLTAGERFENRVEGLRVVATSPRDRCFKRRCIDLLFRTRDGYIAGTTVTVDLTSQTVRTERTIR